MMASLQVQPTSSRNLESLRQPGSSSNDNNKPARLTPETQAKIDAYHAEQTLKHREELDSHAKVRRQCDALKTSRKEKAFTKRGASGPERAGRVYEEPVPLEVQVREEVRKHNSIQAAKSHEHLLKEMEAMRVSQQEEKAEIRRKGNNIIRGN